MRNEVTRVSRSSQQLQAIRRRDAILPEPRLLPLVPEGPVEEGTAVEQQRAIAYWASSREATRL